MLGQLVNQLKSELNVTRIQILDNSHHSKTFLHAVEFLVDVRGGNVQGDIAMVFMNEDFTVCDYSFLGFTNECPTEDLVASLQREATDFLY